MSTDSTDIFAKLAGMTIYDVFDGFDSYVADVESNLEMDSESWEKYLEDPYPVFCDLGDFAQMPAEIPQDKVYDFYRHLVLRHLHRPTSLEEIFPDLPKLSIDVLKSYGLMYANRQHLSELPDYVLDEMVEAIKSGKSRKSYDGMSVFAGGQNYSLR